MEFTLRYTISGALRGAAVLAAAGAGLLVLAGPASAHITVNPGAATQGGSDVEMTFRVPNEQDKAFTTKVEVTFPTDHPIAGVLVRPEPGWTAQVDNTTLAKPIHTDDGDISQVVSKVTWTGGQIQPGQYGAFHVIFGRLPSDTDQVVFKAVQTYSNGNVVRWIDLAQAGQPAPDHPAPVLTLAKASGSDTGSAKPAAGAKAGQTTTASKASSDSTARGLGVAGLIVGVLGLAAGGFGLWRGRRATAASARQ